MWRWIFPSFGARKRENCAAIVVVVAVVVIVIVHIVANAKLNVVISEKSVRAENGIWHTHTHTRPPNTFLTKANDK